VKKILELFEALVFWQDFSRAVFPIAFWLLSQILLLALFFDSNK